jgi:hypothetical protein
LHLLNWIICFLFLQVCFDNANSDSPSVYFTVW